MKRAQWLALVIVVAVVGALAGFGGYQIGYALEADDYHNGIALLDGSGAFPGATGIANWQSTAKQSVLKAQLQGVPELANTVLDIFVAPTPLAEGVKVGTLKIDGKGKGVVNIKVKPGRSFPAIGNGYEITLKTAANRSVAEGIFGAP